MSFCLLSLNVVSAFFLLVAYSCAFHFFCCRRHCIFHCFCVCESCICLFVSFFFVVYIAYCIVFVFVKVAYVCFL